MDRYYHIMDSVNNDPIKMETLELREFYDLIFKKHPQNDLVRKYDLEYVESQDLINRIDYAFEMKQSPWAKDLSFEDFCEYILPYRVGTEVLENWEQDYKSHFEHIFEKLDLNSDSALYIICDSISNMYKAHNYFYPINMPTVKPSYLKYASVAPCSDFTNLFVFIGRTFGIPTAVDFIPNWANHANGHEWSSIIYDGKSLDFMIGEKTSLNGHLRNFKIKFTKVFRKTYGIQPQSLALQAASDENIPPIFRNPRIKDVTTEYIFVTNLHINNLYKNDKRGKRIYVAVFNNKDWLPIDWGNIEDNGAIINNIGYEAIYLPVYYINNECVPAQYPIKVNKQADYNYLVPDKENLQTVILKRKYMEDRAWNFVDSLKGGKFQLSNDRHFSNYFEFNIPDTIEYNYQTININDRYRYIRYIPKPYTDGNIAEIEVYDKNGIQVNGEIIGTYVYTIDTFHDMEHAFDGNVLSYAICDRERGDQWVGLDLGKAVEISKILYLPRSDDNFIKDGELYELFYWDNKWVSLGQQTGCKQIQTLTYNNAPANALLLLKNLTKGVEERIFTYEDGKQVWW